MSGLLKNKKVLAGAVAAAILLSALPTSFAHAGVVGNVLGWAFSSVTAIGGIPGTLIGFAAYVINYIFGFIAAALFSLGGWLVEWALQLNSSIMQNPLIAVGWKITRDLANLGFVLAIIVIAFGTILRSESYGMKKALWKLIVAALLVNFSLVIAGVILDFAGILTNTFLAGSSPEAGLQFHTFAKNLSASFGVNKVLEVAGAQLASEDFQGAFSTFGGSLLSSIASIFFVAVFTFFGAITFLVIAIMIFIRYIVISLLLVVAPLAWLFWIFDDLRHLWSKWWNEFFKWTFFLPSALFFMHLAIYMTLNRSDYVNQQIDALNPSSPDFANAALQIASAPAQIGQMILILGLMYAGLIMSYSISGEFSKVAATTGGWAAGKLQSYGKKKGIQISTAPLRMQALRNRMATWQKDIEEGKGTYVGRAVRSAIARPVQWVQQTGQGLIDDYKKPFKGKSSGEVALRYTFASGPEKAAIMDELAARGDLDKLPTVDMDLYKRYGLNPKTITDRNPLLNDDVMKAIQDNKPDQFKTAIAGVLDKMETAKWGKVQWGDIFEKGIHAGAPDWKNAYLPQLIEAIVRKESAVTKNEFSQLIKTLKPQQRRGLIAHIEDRATRPGAPEMNEQITSYLNTNLGQDMFYGPSAPAPSA